MKKIITSGPGDERNWVHLVEFDEGDKNSLTELPPLKE